MASKDQPSGKALKKYKLNYQFEARDPKEKVFRLTPFFRRGVQLPEKWDLRDKLPEPLTVLDQLHHGTCVIHTIAHSLTFVGGIQRSDADPINDLPESFSPSRMFIYWNARKKAGLPLDEDTGVGIRDAYHAVSDWSACEEHLWPYDEEHMYKEPTPETYKAADAHPNFSSIGLSQDPYALKLCLYQGYPVSIGLQLYDSFMSEEVAATGIVPLPDVEKETCLGGHAMTLIGWDNNKEGESDDVFLVLNSWGDKWGKDGVCRIPVSYICHPNLAGDFHSLRKFY
jgi:C1A family cysteine protease